MTIEEAIGIIKRTERARQAREEVALTDLDNFRGGVNWIVKFEAIHTNEARNFRLGASGFCAFK